MPVPWGVLKRGDLNSVNCFVSGSKRSTPSAAEAQILPLPSTSTVTAPPVPDIPAGGRNTSIASVLGSSRASPPWLGTVVGPTLNQRIPFESRVMPCEPAARPLMPGTLKVLSAPVAASMRPTVTDGFGTALVNHRLPSRSAQASCTPRPPSRSDGVPSNQLLPLLMGYFTGDSAPGSAGTSYSRKTTRAASPEGRGLSLNFIELSPGPCARAR